VPVPMRFTNRVHVMFYGKRLPETLRQNWDVVHCWEEPYIFVGGQIAKWSRRDTTLVYATFQNIPKQYPPPFNLIERYSMKRASGWIAFGRTVAEALEKRTGYSEKAHRVIPPGVDVNLFRPDRNAGREVRRKLNWDERGAPVVGYLGRFVEEKGLQMLMRVLDRTLSDWRALFVGTGPLEGVLRNWGATKGERVKVVTGVKHDEVPHYLNAMDVLCAPSQTTRRWREQFGRMLLESFACGVSVIASDSGEIPHVVGDAGLIVNEKDEQAWACSIACLLEDDKRRNEMRQRGLERVNTTYAWPIVARKHLDFFDELIDSRRDY